MGRCEWFLLCGEPATTTEPHPILGDVPICDRCFEKCRVLEHETELQDREANNVA